MMPSPTKPTASPAMPATSRCLDPQSLPGAQATDRLGRQLGAVEEVAPERAGTPTVRARRAVAAALREQGVAHVRQRLELAHDAVSAPVAARSARTAAQAVGNHP